MNNLQHHTNQIENYTSTVINNMLSQVSVTEHLALAALIAVCESEGWIDRVIVDETGDYLPGAIKADFFDTVDPFNRELVHMYLIGSMWIGYGNLGIDVAKRARNLMRCASLISFD